MKLLAVQASSVFEQFGGIEYYLDDLWTLATEMGHTVEVLLPHRKALQLEPRPYTVQPVQLKGSGLRAKFQNRYSPKVLSTLVKRARAFQPDFLVASHVSLGPLVWAASKLTGIPYLANAYGIEVWGDFHAQDKMALKRAAGILSISAWTQSRLVAQGFLPSQIQLVHPRLATQFEKLPTVHRPLSGPVQLLSVSRLDESEQYKGQDHVLRALALLKQEQVPFEYTLVGDGSDRPRLEALTAELGLTSQVHFVGALKDRADIARYYRAANVFVMPSRYGRWDGRWRGEGFGIVYLEAAAFGLPTIAYDCGGVTDIVDNGVNGILVRPDDIQALATAIGELALDPMQTRALGQNAYEKVNRRFTREAIQQELGWCLATLDSKKAVKGPHLDTVTAFQFRAPDGQ